MSIRKGDQVVVISGKEKGKKGRVSSVDEKRVTVEGVNIVTKHEKPRGQTKKGGRKKEEAPIDISNVMILCKCGKAVRVAHKIDEKGVKHRVCSKCGEILDKKFVKAKEKAKEAVEVKEEDKEKEAKKPLVRREVKSMAESKVKKSQNVGGSSATHRQIGGA
jgi:large subunit ribosomal protein L24